MRRVVGYAILTFFAVLFLGPFVLSVVTSFKTRPDFAQNPVSLVPDPVTTEWWRQALGLTESPVADVPRWLVNTVVVALVVMVARVLLDSLAGYALARMNFPGRRLLFAGIIAVLAVPPIVLLVPRFLVLKELSMYATYSALILPLAADATGIFIMRQFFLAMPRELEEAARIDGAGVLRTWWSVILPLARPGVITLAILSFQSSWNEFPHMLIANNKPELYTLPVGLALIRGSQGQDFNFPFFLATATLTMIPVAIVFFVFQRYFVRGLMEGAVKG
ncbi:carbohydrate ABC transporter permease [Thermoactinospora rubra]|uniref:carbohydrate ABC transporter permease n=1 Tax=Thermoactinospora rubra TaxID=1088767 RepID=UPI0019814FFA|nr:carbohydrate ABC transporter permease [Thermoactinospora rubra]